MIKQRKFLLSASLLALDQRQSVRVSFQLAGCIAWILLECSWKALPTDWGRQGQALSRKPNATIKEKNSTQDSFVSLLFMYELMCILLVVFQIARWILTEVSFAFILKRSANGPTNTVWSFKFISLYFDFLFESIYSVTLTKIISMECKHEDRNPSRESFCTDE